MVDILAIVSKAVFEKDGRIGTKPLALKDVWPVDRYNSNSKPLERLKDGGRIFLVTVRPPNEQLWFLGVVESPKLDGNAWISASKNTLAVTDISSLRKAIRFESGNGMSQDRGTLGMSLQTPRALTSKDVSQILGLVSGKASSTLASPGAPASKSAPAEDPMSPRPSSIVAANGRIIGGKYEVLGKLGQGGMGTVYEARHTGTGRRVAVKEVKEIVGNDSTRGSAQIIERFEREARATGAIDSQHIALVLDSGTDDATHHPFLVMELLKGEDLQQLLARLGPLPPDLALRVAGQAALGLHRAHEAGVVHRDIKPANIFLARREGGEVVVKLLDFGIARVKEQLQAPESPALTTTGLMLGTPLYMSPEQALGPKNTDHRTDLWSLGVVLYEALTGHTPHDVETVGALILAICTKAARPVDEVAPHVTAPVTAMVKRMLEINSGARYPSAVALLDDLKSALPGGFAIDESMLVSLPESVRRTVERNHQPMELADTVLKQT